MAEKYDLKAMLREIAEDEGETVAAPAKQLSQDEIRRLAAEKRKARGGRDAKP